MVHSTLMCAKWKKGKIITELESIMCGWYFNTYFQQEESFTLYLN